MKDKLSLKHSMELVATLITVVALLGVLQTFVIGKHYVIPTAILLMAVLFGNLARFGYQGKLWARHILFWIGFMICSHTFFALFWAARPRQILGDAFMPVYGAIFVLFAFLIWQYARKNELFGRR